jgi:hypothetical protein
VQKTVGFFRKIASRETKGGGMDWSLLTLILNVVALVALGVVVGTSEHQPPVI